MPVGTLISVEACLATAYRPDCDYVDGARATAVQGLCEVKSGILKTENPALQTPLAEIFE